MKLLPKVKDAMEFCPTMGMKYMGDKKKKRDAKKRVKAPAGFHWMKEGKKAPKLMKHTGKFVPHKGASLYTSFDIQKLHKKK
jgi:hypothetical protein